MATQVEPKGSAPSAVDQLQRLIERFGLIAAGLVALAGSIATFWTDTQPAIRWSVIALAAGALLFVVVGRVAMPAIEAQRRRKVIAIPEASLRGPTTFRLRPYEEADHAAFDRPDRAQHEALRWLKRADEPFLYLTGFSGTGKSSLLHAWLVPELAAGEPPTRTLVARSYADPISQLLEALTKPGVIWDKRPPSADSPRALLEKAAERVRPARLLVVIDQFEECLILQDEAGRAQLAALFRDLRERPLPGLTFLLMLRDDYLDFDALRGLGLPEVRSDGNWFRLNALSRGDARQVLDDRVAIDASLREKVLDEASEVDDLPGLVRPITLNMLGLVLQRFRGGALTDTAPGRLIQDYLRQAMAKPGIDAVAPRLLAPMITDHGTKRPVAEPALAERTGVEPALVRKTLLLLAQEGVVRELEPDRRLWEISHDFVARQLGQIIPRLRPSAFHRLQKTLAPAALAAWLVLLPALALGAPEVMERLARNALSEAGVSIPWSNDLGGYDVDLGTASERNGAVARLHGWLRWLRPIRSLRISDDADLADLAPLLRVIEPEQLTRLSLSGDSELQAIEGLDALTNLARLSIGNHDALEAISLAGLGNLSQLNIAGNDRLRTIEGMGDLSGLVRLSISYNDALRKVDGLDALGSLMRLNLNNNEALQTVDLAGLDALDQLLIANNPALEEIAGLGGLARLRQLEITSNQALHTIDGIGGLTGLVELRLGGTDRLAAIDGLDSLTNLTSLNLSYHDALTAISVAGLENLTSLIIVGNAALEQISGLGTATNLTHLWIGDNDALRTIRGLDGLEELIELRIYDNGELETIEGLHGLDRLGTLHISGNGRLRAVDGLGDLETLTELQLYDNAALQTIDGLDRLSSLEELRLEAPDPAASLAQVAKLPMLRRLMLPDDQKGIAFERAGALPPVEIQFTTPGSEKWWVAWEPQS